MDKKNVTIIDLLEPEYLQLLQDSFAHITGCTVVLADAKGNRLPFDGNFTAFCEKIRDEQDKDTCCSATIRGLCAENRQTGKPAVEACPYTGLTMGAVPFFLDQQYLGSWIISQIRLENSDAVVRQPSPANLPREEVEAFIQQLPVVTKEQFHNMIYFLTGFTTTLVKLARVNFHVAQCNLDLLETAERLELTAQMLTKFTNSADVGMYVTDFFTGEILQANNQYAQFMNKSIDELTGAVCWACVDPEHTFFCPDCPHDKLLDEKGQPCKPITWEKYLPDRELWLRYTNQAIYWVDGRLAHMVTFVDITRIKQMQTQLAQLAYYDRNMQLPNGVKLALDLDQWDTRDGVFLICFDIVSLRSINDVYGREAGDALLESICDWIRRLQIQNSLIYRIEGDTFCLALQGSDASVARLLAERIYVRFEDPWIFPLNGETLRIFCSISMGIIDCARQTDNSEDILNLIERILDSARKSGWIASYDEEMDQNYKEHLKLELSLKKCVKEGMVGFEVYYQPIVDASLGIWSSVEALCRWVSPECGPVPAIVFIHEAEQLGLIGAIGRWVLEVAVSQCKAWGLDKHPSFILDVNLSPTQITDEAFVYTVLEILHKYRYPGNRLSLEITESTEFNFTNHTLHAIERLRAHQIQVALDDFGTGYSSFNNLKQLPVSILKTERAFIMNIENDSYLQYLFHVMVELAHAAGMKIIAEGVETAEQLDLLLKHGADFLQGYLFSEPLSANELEKKLNRFYHVDPTLYPLPPKRNNGKSGSGRDNYAYTPNLYQVLISCMQILISHSDSYLAINQVLKIVGQKFRVSRVYLFLAENNGTYSNTNEWCADGIESQKQKLKEIDFETCAPSWLESLKNDNIIIASDIQTLPEDIREVLNPRGIHSIAVVPLWSDSQLTGFIGFDDCLGPREWPPEEIMMLHNLCMIIGTTVEKRKLHQEILNRNAILSRLMDSLDISIYVADIETNEILFINNKMQQMFGSGSPLEGNVSWTCLWGDEAGCCDRRSQEMSGENSNVWERVDPRTGCHYRIYNSIIPWEQGKSAYLGSMLDITDIKETQKQLEQLSHYDILSRILNRRTLMKRLTDLVQKAYETGSPLTICSIDIDNLSYINREHGFHAGDELIQLAANALTDYVRKEDILGRFDGDEFILALPGCLYESAEEKLCNARADMQKRSAYREPDCLFSYGIAEDAEIPFENADKQLYRLLQVSHARMLQYKSNRKKIE